MPKNHENLSTSYFFTTLFMHINIVLCDPGTKNKFKLYVVYHIQPTGCLSP